MHIRCVIGWNVLLSRLFKSNVTRREISSGGTDRGRAGVP
jgi:hypothetical protein